MSGDQEREEVKKVKVVGNVRTEVAEFSTPPDILTPAVLGGETVGVTVLGPRPSEMSEVHKLAERANPLSKYSHLISSWQSFYLNHLPNVGASPKLGEIVLQVKSFADAEIGNRPSETASLVLVDKDTSLDFLFARMRERVVLCPVLSRVFEFGDFFISDRPLKYQSYAVWLADSIHYLCDTDKALADVSMEEIVKRGNVKVVSLLEYLLGLFYLQRSSAWPNLRDDFKDLVLCAGSRTRRKVMISDRTRACMRGISSTGDEHWVPLVKVTGDIVEVKVVPPDFSAGAAYQVTTPYEGDVVR